MNKSSKKLQKYFRILLIKNNSKTYHSTEFTLKKKTLISYKNKSKMNKAYWNFFRLKIHYKESLMKN